MGSHAAQIVLRVINTAVLARLLTPTDYGLVGMVTVVVNFAAMFKDAGLSMATVQRDEITHDQISTLFWINLLISAALGLCVLISSPLVAWFYGEPELTAITAALSLSFLLSGLTIQHQALLRRHMRFGAIAGIQIGSQTISLIAMIIMAHLGLRYWALVAGTLVNALVMTVLTFFFFPWVPGRAHRGTGVRDMLRFGGHLTGFNFINYFSRNADSILIGRFVGADALGLYTRAYQLFTMPVGHIRGPIDDVAVAALCTIKDDTQRYRSYYRKTVFLVAALSMPLVGFSMVFAENIILVVLGAQWLEAARVYQVLALAGLLQSAAQAGRALPLMSMGFSRRYFWLGVLQSSVTVLGMALGLRWGIVGVAAGYGIAFSLLVPFTMGWCLKDSPASYRDWIHAMVSPASATTLMLLTAIWLRSILIQGVSIAELSLYQNIRIIIAGGAASLATYIMGTLLLPSGREYLTSAVYQIRRTLSSYRAPTAS